MTPASIHDWAVIHQGRVLYRSTELTEALTWRRTVNGGVGIIKRVDAPRGA